MAEKRTGEPSEYAYCSSGDWEEVLWEAAAPIYTAAFPEHGRKPERIIRTMFRRNMCRLHLARLDGRPAAMAVSGPDRGRGIWIVDYLAVAEEQRGKGVGRRFVADIRQEAEAYPWCRGMVVEAEAEETEANRARIRFWQTCGFRLTDYVHQYIWVPEPYRALALSFPGREPLSADGRELFKAITGFHERAYRR